MAKYQVEHSCGCTETHELFGKHVERERKIEWMQDQSCTECRKMEFAKKCTEENAAAAEANSDLVALVGSEKQVAWAESIRAKYLSDAESLMSGLVPSTDLEKSLFDQLSELLSDHKEKSFASWWIDNRSSSFREVAMSAARKMEDVA